jgi:hypothetical protein
MGHPSSRLGQDLECCVAAERGGGSDNFNGSGSTGARACLCLCAGLSGLLRFFAEGNGELVFAGGGGIVEGLGGAVA